MNQLFLFIYRTLLEARAPQKGDIPPEALYPQVQKMLAAQHQTTCEGYGWRQTGEGKLMGSYKTWRQFFMVEAPQWLSRVREAEVALVGQDAAAAVIAEIERFVTKALRSRLLQFEGGVLVHGDAINPGNLVIAEGALSAIAPWEYSLIGDPAWEFCEPLWEGVYAQDRLAPYVEAVKSYTGKAFDKGGFMRRVRLYRPLWLLWRTSLEAESPRSLLYALLRDMLQSELKAIR